jgi:predicted acetyltransferase
MATFELRTPTIADFPAYLSALEESNTEAKPSFYDPIKVKADFEADPERFIARLNDPVGGWVFENRGGVVRAALPSRSWWSFVDGEACGLIQLRWDRKGNELPIYCLGHIGYAIFPRFQGRGLAQAQLREVIAYAKGILPEYVELVTKSNNEISARVIQNCGGQFIEDFISLPEHGEHPSKRWRIYF